MSGWRPDVLPGFEALDLPAPDDYDGAVTATLVRFPGRREAPLGPVLYVHGFSDYFFQRHMAERFSLEGFAFYALDLRKHGRSLLPGQHPCFCKCRSTPELTRAIEEIGAPVLLAGHSAGGLVCSLYAHEGERRSKRPVLNGRSSTGSARHAAGAVGLRRRARPRLPVPQGPAQAAAGVHAGPARHWEFDTRLKPVEGSRCIGWISAISQAHARVHRCLAISCPVLAMLPTRPT
jgi:alpha-beta hydrolase superfamily lysophospholipase